MTVENLTEGSTPTFDRLGGYDADGLVADAEGKVYLWLPNGTHVFFRDGRAMLAVVDDADVVATEWTTGVTVDGADVATLSGDGWSYDIDTAVLTLSSNSRDYTLSGTNTDGDVSVVVSAGYVNAIISNLVLCVTNVERSAIYVNDGLSTTLTLAGTNVLMSGENCPGVRTRATIERDGSYYTYDAYLDIKGTGTLLAVGGQNAAGIGGGQRENGSYVSVYGGELEARGGMNGAGIGGGWRGKGGNLSVYGGRVTAVGGTYASAIGGGFGETGERYFQNNGTVIANGGSVNLVTADAISSSGRGNIIRGGSLHVTGEKPTISNPPVNGSNVRVWCVTVTNLVPGAKVVLDGLSGYGTSDIFADDTGAVYLWLPNGAHLFSTQIGEETWRWRADVSGADTVAVAVTGPDGLTITGIALTETAVTITVASDPAEWMASGYASLRVRAGAALPLPAGDEALLDESLVTATLNADGTATLTFPRSSSDLMFYRIER